MKNEKQNIGLAVQPYVEGCSHSTSTLACCFMPAYAKSGVRHLYIMGVYSSVCKMLDVDRVLDTCTLKTDKNFIKS